MALDGGCLCSHTSSSYSNSFSLIIQSHFPRIGYIFMPRSSTKLMFHACSCMTDKCVNYKWRMIVVILSLMDYRTRHICRLIPHVHAAYSCCTVTVFYVVVLCYELACIIIYIYMTNFKMGSLKMSTLFTLFIKCIVQFH